MQTEASGAPILAARVIKSYGEETVLKGISLDIAEGDLARIHADCL
jgi:ABC-type histidine transport system ATPase subunit